jgi:hypothetical protein
MKMINLKSNILKSHIQFLSKKAIINIFFKQRMYILYFYNQLIKYFSLSLPTKQLFWYVLIAKGLYYFGT